MNGKTKRTFDLKNDVELAKGKNTILSGTLTVDITTNNYKVRVTEEENNNCLFTTDVSALVKDNIVKCDTINGVEYHISTGSNANNIVSFAGTSWYIFNDSNYADDYVTLIKAIPLTKSEIEQNYSYVGSNGKEYDGMAYYWSLTCNSYDTIYGGVRYNHTDYSGCNNSYETSKIKEFLEEIYIKTLGESNLKKVDNNKIKLITITDLVNKFSYSYDGYYNKYKKGSQTPAWVYSYSYWTMTPYNDWQPYVYQVGSDGNIMTDRRTYYLGGVRPVINLYKSALQ